MNGRTVLLSFVALLGACATPPPNPELEGARVEVARAYASPLRDRAPYELRQAAAALAAAERADRVDPTSIETSDTAYLARRLAERARIVALWSAEVDALELSERTVRRIRTNLDRRRSQHEDRVRREREVEVERWGQREALVRALVRARGPGQIDDDGLITLRVQQRELFRYLEPRLLPDASVLLGPIARALRSGLPIEVRVVVTEGDAAYGADAAQLARKRAEAIRDALREQGVPYDQLVSAEGRPGEGRWMTLELTERPLVVPPVEPP